MGCSRIRLPKRAGDVKPDLWDRFLVHQRYDARRRLRPWFYTAADGSRRMMVVISAREIDRIEAAWQEPIEGDGSTPDAREIDMIEACAARFDDSKPALRFVRGRRPLSTDADCVRAYLFHRGSGLGPNGVAAHFGGSRTHARGILARGKRLVDEAARRGEFDDLMA